MVLRKAPGRSIFCIRYLSFRPFNRTESTLFCLMFLSERDLDDITFTNDDYDDYDSRGDDDDNDDGCGCYTYLISI